jgi:antitoxin component of RelBE/YafQ-DinJ toxin-antitoxin module
VQKTSQINIRFDAETEAQLNVIAEELGVTKSALVRRLTEKFLAEVKRLGAVNLNPQWISEIGKADARAKWGERKLNAAEEDQDLSKASKKSTKRKA